MLKLTNKQPGFTIVELAIVIAVIVILVSLSVVSYIMVVKRTADAELKAVVEQVEAGINHRRSATYNVVPDRGTSTRADFMSQYQITDIDADVNVRYERGGCNDIISDDCSAMSLSKEKVNFYVTEEVVAAGRAAAAAARVIYWSAEQQSFVMTKTAYDSAGQMTVTEASLASDSDWTDAI